MQHSKLNLEATREHGQEESSISSTDFIIPYYLHLEYLIFLAF